MTPTKGDLLKFNGQARLQYSLHFWSLSTLFVSENDLLFVGLNRVQIGKLGLGLQGTELVDDPQVFI